MSTHAVHVDRELARRIEVAEGRLLAEAVSLHRRDVTSRAFVLPVGGGVAVGLDVGSPVNKVIGAGFDEVTRETLERAEGAFEFERLGFRVAFTRAILRAQPAA